MNIDVSKLKRDYISNPLYKSKNGKGNEKPYKEDFIYLYLKLNMDRKRPTKKRNSQKKQS